MTKCSWSAHHHEIAIDYGVNESIFVSYVFFWIKDNEKAQINFKEGRTWICDSLPNLSEKLPWWTTRQIERIIASCVSKNLILQGRHSDQKMDRTNWHTLTDTALEMFQKVSGLLMGGVSHE